MKGEKIVVLLMAILLVIPLIKAGSVESTSSSADGDIEPTTTTESTGSLSTESENTNLIPVLINPDGRYEEADETSNDSENHTNATLLIPGDIIFEYWEKIKIDGVDVDHTALYVGNGKLVEADPYINKWTPREKFKYNNMAYLYHASKRINPSFELGPNLKKFVHELQNRSYGGNTVYGKVEEDDFGDVYNASFYCYGRVWIDDNTPAYPSMRKEAVDYAKERASPKWPLVGENGLVLLNRPRPFDYISPWIRDEKQCDEYTVEMVLNNLSLAKTLDYGYGCSELVWAAWWHATRYEPKEKRIDLDSDNTIYKYVWPWEIKDSPHMKIYYNSTEKSNTADETSQPMNLKLIYTDKIVYVDNVEDVEEVNGEYYLKTSSNELYSMDGLMDFEVLQ